MKKRKKVIITIIQIVMVIAFAFSYKLYNDNNVQPIEIFAFKRNIDEGVKITEKDLEVQVISKIAYRNTMVRTSELNKIVGKYTVTKVYAGNIVYTNQLGDINSVDRFSSMDLSNSRIISLPINFVEGFAGDIQRGDRVDLLYKGKGVISSDGFGSDTEFVYSKIFLQDIPVYQVNTDTGYKFIPHAHVAEGEKYAETTEVDISGMDYQQIASISLVVTPEQAEQIEARRMNGEIKFLKRFPESETHETLGFVIGNYGKIFSGNANAETGNLQVIDNFKEDGSFEEIDTTQ